MLYLCIIVLFRRSTATIVPAFFAKEYRKRMDIYSLLDSVPTTLGKTTISYLMDYGKIKNFDVGDVVFREDDICTGVYIILSGVAQVIKSDNFGNSNVIASAGEGSVFGEMGVFLNLQRSGTISAKTALSVLTLDNQDFISALQHFPDLSLRLFKSLSTKLNTVNGQLANLLNAMTMVQVGTFLLEYCDSDDGEQTQSFNLNLATQETQLQRRDIVSALINYNRLNLITDLQFRDNDGVAYCTEPRKLRTYIKQISLRPSDA